jgi:tetratricopeptide (TPR) repeat protein
LARTVTARISRFLNRRGLYKELADLNEDLLAREEHPAPLQWIGKAYLARGDYPTAKEKYGRAQTLLQQIGNHAGEASTWHQLASIDLNVGDYEAAREKFGRSMAIAQQIGDHAGEAATFYQLGMLARDQERPAEGAALVALCYLIDKAIGHGETQSDFRTLSTMTSQLAYTQEQIDDLLRRVAEAYQADRGAGLLRAAFPDA